MLPARSLVVLVAGAVTAALGGTQVFFDNIAAPLLYVGPNQVNAVAPYGINPTNSNPPVTRMTVQRGIGQALVINQDSTLNSAANPAPRGSVVTFYAEGAGLMAPSMTDGAVAPLVLPLPAPALPISVTVRGEPATVQYAGAAPGYVSGLLQSDVVAPTTINFGSDVPLFPFAGGTQSQLQLSMAVK